MREERSNGFLYNSLELSQEGERIFSHLMESERVNIYTRNTTTGELTFESTLHLGAHSEVVHVDKGSGSVYVGELRSVVAHKLYQTFTHRTQKGDLFIFMIPILLLYLEGPPPNPIRQRECIKAVDLPPF